MKIPAKLMQCTEWEEDEGRKKAESKEEQTALQETIPETKQANMTKELSSREVTRTR